MTAFDPSPHTPRNPVRERFELVLALSFRCNMACSYCYVKPDSSDVLPRAWASRALDLALAELAPGGRLDLGFFGGEPLLTLELMLEVCREAREKAAATGVRVEPLLTTNGTLLTPEATDALVAAGFDLTVSVDGTAAAHDSHRVLKGGGGTHALVAANLEAAIARGADPAVNLVVSPDTVGDLAAGVRELVEAGVRKVVLSPDHDARWGREAMARCEAAYKELGELYVERALADRPFALSFIEEKVRRALAGGTLEADRCAFGVGELAVDPRGRVFPCERLLREEGGDELVIGQLPGGVDPARLAALRAPMGTPVDDCTGCSLATMCSNWCPCVNLSRTGTVHEPDGLVCFLEDLAVRVSERVADAVLPDVTAGARGVPV